MLETTRKLLNGLVVGNCIQICRNGRFLVKLGDGQGSLHVIWNVTYWKEDSSENKLWIKMKNKTFIFK